tara:strand:- start:1237 stop:1506 length:270 start_codon:yes stop_codon:yes gene_type:complete
MKITKKQLRRLVKEAWQDPSEEDLMQDRLVFLDAQTDIWAEMLESSHSPGIEQQIRQGLEDLYDRLVDDLFRGGQGSQEFITLRDPEVG